MVIAKSEFQKFFGILRQVGGNEDHPTVTSFLHLYRLLCIYCPTARMVRGNVTATEDDPLALTAYAEGLLRRGKEERHLSKLRRQDIDDEILAKIIASNEPIEVPSYERDHDYCKSKTEDCVVYHLCGYLAHRAEKAGIFTKCQSCIASLRSHGNPAVKEGLLTWTKDKGALQYPSSELVRIISQSIEPQIRQNLCGPLKSSIVADIVQSIDSIDCEGVGCPIPDHSEKLVSRLVSFYVTIRMFFFTKTYNREVISSRLQAKRQRKASKLT